VQQRTKAPRRSSDHSEPVCKSTPGSSKAVTLTSQRKIWRLCFRFPSGQMGWPPGCGCLPGLGLRCRANPVPHGRGCSAPRPEPQQAAWAASEGSAPLGPGGRSGAPADFCLSLCNSDVFCTCSGCTMRNVGLAVF